MENLLSEAIAHVKKTSKKKPNIEQLLAHINSQVLTTATNQWLKKPNVFCAQME